VKNFLAKQLFGGKLCGKDVSEKISIEDQLGEDFASEVVIKNLLHFISHP
jgi:hypothetical protein